MRTLTYHKMGVTKIVMRMLTYYNNPGTPDRDVLGILTYHKKEVTQIVMRTVTDFNKSGTPDRYVLGIRHLL